MKIWPSSGGLSRYQPRWPCGPHFCAIFYSSFFCIGVIITETLQAAKVGKIVWQNTNSAGYSMHMLAVGISISVCCSALSLWLSRMKYPDSWSEQKQKAVYCCLLISCMIMFYHFRRSVGWMLVSFSGAGAEEPPLRQMTWLCTHAIILDTLADTCKATKASRFIFQLCVWLGQAFSLRAFVAESYSIYVLVAITGLAITTQCILLAIVRNGALKEYDTNASSPSVLCAKYVMPLLIPAWIAYVSIWMTYGFGLTSLETVANGATTVDIVIVGISAATMSDVVWLRGQEAEQLAQRRAEEAAAAKAAQESQREFLRFICHELRVPLNGAVLAIEDAIDEAPKVAGCALHEDLGTVSICLDAASTLLDDFLSYAKIEAGALELEFAPFSPTEMVKSAAMLFEHAFARKNVELSMKIDASVPDTISSDMRRLSQVLRNFLSNALKFTPPGGHVSVRLGRAAPRHSEECAVFIPESLSRRQSAEHTNNSWIRRPPGALLEDRSQMIEISVRDNGVGISQDDQQHLFVAFRQINAGAMQKGNGTGLGLSISKHIIQACGGIIGCTSSVGQGSTFFFRIPCPFGLAPLSTTLSECDAQQDRTAPSVEPSASFTTHADQQHTDSAMSITSGGTSLMVSPHKLKRLRRATVVDDVASNRRPFVKFLKKLGAVEVHEAENGSLALMDPAWQDDDLWLVDRSMPVMDGATLVKQLRSHGYSGIIIGITGDALAEDQATFLSAGLDAVMTKPCHHRALLAKLVDFGFNFDDQMHGDATAPSSKYLTE